MGVAKLSITFFLQMAIIVATCRIIGPLFEAVYGKEARARGELTLLRTTS